MRVRPEFGPALPHLARGRFGIPAWLTAALLLALVLAALFAVMARSGTDGRTDLVHRGHPAFNVLYEERHVRPAALEGDELARFEARRRGAGVHLTVRGLPDSDLPFGALPLYAERHLDALRTELGSPRIRAEAKARIWGHPGYRIEYAAKGLRGTDVLLFPDDTELRGGAVLSFRLDRSGRRGGQAVAEVRRVMRSFQFGAARR